jgi:hypothetical protein
MRVGWNVLAALALAIAGLVLMGAPAKAIPAFASQTGQPCTACHVGAYGPQLTPLGRAFKIGGYTQRGGEGWQSYVPLSAMVVTSFTNTGSAVPPDAVVHHYNHNNNIALDAVSTFLGGGIGEHTGGLVQFTYSIIPNASKLDNTDLRPYTTTFDLGGNELRIGTTVNNNPTVQDPYNSTFAWGFPLSRPASPRHLRHHRYWPAASTTTRSATRRMRGTTTVSIWKREPTRRLARGRSPGSETTSGSAARKASCLTSVRLTNGTGTARPRMSVRSTCNQMSIRPLARW